MQFVKSAVDFMGCPDDSIPEVALVGRSNSGKSSLINALASSKIAKVSSMPGKTRVLNFFLVAHRYRLVDMPGYGFAARAGNEQSSWQVMVEDFLASRRNLQGLLVLMDIRRDWSEDEEMLLKWIAPRGLPCAIVLSKADKLSKTEILKRVKQLQKDSGLSAVFAVSSPKKTGFMDLEEFYYSQWIKPALGSAGQVEEESE